MSKITFFFYFLGTSSKEIKNKRNLIKPKFSRENNKTVEKGFKITTAREITENIWGFPKLILDSKAYNNIFPENLNESSIVGTISC